MKQIQIILLITILIQVSQAVKIKSESKAVKQFPDLLLQIGQRTQIKSRGKDNIDSYECSTYTKLLQPQYVSWDISVKEAQNYISDKITNVTNYEANFPSQGLRQDQVNQDFSNNLLINKYELFPILYRLSYEQLKEALLSQNQTESQMQSYIQNYISSFNMNDLSTIVITKQFVDYCLDLQIEYLKELLSLSQSITEPMTMTMTTAQAMVSNLVSYFQNALVNIPPQGYSDDAWLQLVYQTFEKNNNAAREFLISQLSSQAQCNQFGDAMRQAVKPISWTGWGQFYEFLDPDYSHLKLTKQQQKILLNFFVVFYSTLLKLTKQ